MKNAIATFVERHPIMSFIIVMEVAGAARDTIVGVTRAITGKYPPEEPKAENSEESAKPKVSVVVHDSEEDPDDLDFLK